MKIQIKMTGNPIHFQEVTRRQVAQRLRELIPPGANEAHLLDAYLATHDQARSLSVGESFEEPDISGVLNQEPFPCKSEDLEEWKELVRFFKMLIEKKLQATTRPANWALPST